MAEQAAQDLIGVDHRLDPGERGQYHGQQALRHVIRRAIVGEERLLGQADPQIAAIAPNHAQPAQHVLGGLVAHPAFAQLNPGG